MIVRVLISVAIGLFLGPYSTVAQSLEPSHHSGGINVNLYATAGKPLMTGDANEVWDAVGGLGIVPGFGVRLGYRWYRLGIEGGFDLTAANPSDRDGLGGGVNLLAVVRVAPESKLDPTIAVGFVREGMLADFNAGEFPIGIITSDPAGRPDVAGPAGTFGNGIRLDLGSNVNLRPSLDLTLDAIADFVWFGTASYNDFDYTLQESGVAFWPRVAVGLRWDP